MGANERLHARARRHLVGGVDSPVRAFKAVGGTPPSILRARGAYLWDAGGKRLLDYIGGWGPHILGHAHPAIVSAIARANRLGSGFGLPAPAETELAELIKGALPSIQLIRFVNSGTEATMSALRLARAATKRNLIVKFDGCYHGHADGLLAGAGSGLATFGIPASPGVPRAFARLTLTLPFNDTVSLRSMFRRQGREIAAVIVEPVVGNMGVIPPLPGFLEELRAVTKRHGALLIFDEVMTGFRVAWGGAQRLYGIRPDLTCLGKVIGGGFPVGAYGGRADLMRMLAPLGPVYQAGTLSGNPVAMAAGIAALKQLKRRSYRDLAAATSELCARLRRAAGAAGAKVNVGEVCGMFTAFFTGRPVLDADGARRADKKAYARVFNRLRRAGILFPPSQFEAAFVGFAHTSAHFRLTSSAFASALAH